MILLKGIPYCCSEAQFYGDLCKKCTKKIFRAFATVKCLEDILEFLQIFKEELFDGSINQTELPTFGGKDIDQMEVWSWDETRVIIGECADDFKIISREELNEKQD